MISDKKIARIAGLLYLGIVITGIFSLMYVPKSLIDWTNATNTINHIRSNQTLYRLGIVSGLLCYTLFLLLPFVLYKLLNRVNDNLAKLMVFTAFVSVPIYFINVQNQFTILSLVSVENHLSGFSSEQIKSLVMLYLDQYENGMRMVHIFSGLWLFPFGHLVYKSGFLPKILGILLMLGCFGYLINFTGNMFVANYSEMGIASYIRLPASIGEIGICFWLLVMGVKNSA